MSYKRRLIRGIDQDLVDRIAAGGKPKPAQKPPRTKTVRDGSTYRGARRNERRVIRANQLAAKRCAKA